MKYFSSNLRVLRLKKGMTQAKIAADIGFKRTAWTSYETGTSTPILRDLIKIVDYFGIKSNQLLEEDLSNVDLNEKLKAKKGGNNVDVKVDANVDANNRNCVEILEIKEEVIKGKDALIESLKAQIKMLNEQLERNK